MVSRSTSALGRRSLIVFNHLKWPKQQSVLSDMESLALRESWSVIRFDHCNNSRAGRIDFG